MNILMAMQHIAELEEEFTKLSDELMNMAAKCLALREKYKVAYSTIGEFHLNRDPDRQRMEELLNKLDPMDIREEAVRQILDRVNVRELEEEAAELRKKWEEAQ